MVRKSCQTDRKKRRFGKFSGEYPWGGKRGGRKFRVGGGPG